ncbi:hypothetical protein D3C76_1203250 [compost metagenome]
MVRSLRMVAHAAMPMAPPRLRIRLNNPEACLSRAGARPPRVKVTAGGTASCWAIPRRACGSINSLAPQSWVIGLKSHIDKANRPRPDIMIQRRSTRLARKAYSGIAMIWNTPVEKTARPMSSAP